MNAKRITAIARGLTQLRVDAICVLIACSALASALYSCSEPPPAQQQPTPLPPTLAAIAPTTVPAARTPQSALVDGATASPGVPAARAPQSPTPAIAAAIPVPASPTPQSTIEPTPTLTPTPTPITPTPQSTMEPAPTPTPVPDFVSLPDDAQFTQITAGEHHACGLQANGTTLCWGRNISGSLELPGGNPSFTRISAGENFSCGLRIAGAIACWGENKFGQASPPNGRFDEIATGRRHACALDDGALICWGRDFPEGAAVTIQEVPPLSNIQAGGDFTCGLTPDADMACWNNGRNELSITSGPFVDIATGLNNACAIKSDNSVFCSERSTNLYRGLAYPPPTKFAQISVGWHHACGITETSDIECWGSGVRGAPGERLNAPEGKFDALAIGRGNSCALRVNGHAVCWQQPDLQNLSELPEAFGGVEFDWPVELFPLPSGRLAVVERKGLIAAHSDEPNAAPPQTMLDLTNKTICCKGENGMLSAALDPQFEEFPFLYVYYRLVNRPAYGENMPGLASRLARFRIEGGQAIRNSELTILEVSTYKKYHYGGAIRFGADGMLYLGIGDNSNHEDAQSLDTLLGKVIRIDVRGATPEQPYQAPPDNPFVNNPEARPEIWAYGLRNPWRMDFAPDGRLFIADVGDWPHEEVSLAAAGANLGWPICEGNACEEGTKADADGLTAPIYTYDREDGCAIIGGVTVPWLNNGFLFGDFCSKRVWLLEQDEREGWQTRIVAPRLKGSILSFGMDTDGTVYVLIRRNPIMRLQIDAEE